MLSNLEIIIGIEIHLELNTKTKLFSSAPNDFEALPNTCVSPIDLALPGTLPQLNKEAVVKAIKLAKALNMKIDNELHFDRKNYFYTDLPKGYQITQQFRPIGTKGTIVIKDSYNKDKIININRIHIEEDTARQIHKDENTYLNYNRAGVPLIEIVSEAEIKSSIEAVNYVNNIALIAKFLNISDSIMAKGSLRVDINLSTRLKGQKDLGTKVEIKNLNSINNIKTAIELETKKQIQQIMENKNIVQETKRFSEEKQDVITMRIKDNNIDYKYFPDPNIPVILLEQNFIDSITIEELPNQMIERMKNLNIPEQYINNFLIDSEQREYFSSIHTNNNEEWSKIFFAEIVPLAKNQNQNLNNLNINKDLLTKTINYYLENKINRKQLKTLIPLLINNKKDIEAIIEENNLKIVDDSELIRTEIINIINNYENLKIDYLSNKDRCLKFVLGQLMKIMKGNVDPIKAKTIVIELLEKNAL
ncbi:MAG: Asp-tRNA(Asn)/Glu-tRNA(Gln) amidotransferase subunit GatB [Metamycoplasmataceae bacterium]